MSERRTNTHGEIPNENCDEQHRHEASREHTGSVDRYTAGWICALQEEYESACRMLDEELEHPEALDENDDNTYTFGRVGPHCVVVGCLPAGRYGTNSAARVVRDMARSFPRLRFALMVGIGGGLPSAKHDIRLGDVVVGMPNGATGGVVQYDLGRRLPNGVFQRTGHLNAPPEKLLGAIPEIRKRCNDPRYPDTIAEHLRRMDDMPDYQRPTHDRLYRAEYLHQGGENCHACDTDQLVRREERKGRAVVVHYGTIVSGNSVIKDATVRDAFANSELNALCFEMEAAGLMNNVPCLLIRGICDYSDSHKNDDWHKYAALAAAAYARELLLVVKQSRVMAIPTWVDEIKTVIASVSGNVQEVQSSFDEERLRRWLSPPDPSTNFNAAISSLEPGTGTWLLGSEGYKSWKRDRGTPIWLCGIPGSGKTILSSSIIQDCAGVTASASTSLVYFYFDCTDPGKQTPSAMLRSLIWQLAAASSDAKTALPALFEGCNGGQTQPSLHNLLLTFGKMLSNKKDVYIVVDALDECTEPGTVIQWIQLFLRQHKNALHLCVSSRQEKEIEGALETIVPSDGWIMLNKDRVNMDIRSFVRRKLQVDQGLDKWKLLPNMRGKIEREIMKKADGMFRWAVCQLNSIRECLDLPMLLQAPLILPRTMEETYSRILLNILGRHREYATRILQWLVYATRPLRIEEIVDVIAVRLEEGGPAFEPQNRLLDVKDILIICSSFITIEELDQGRIVKLSHLSVRDYLVSDQAQAVLRSSMEVKTANAAIASVCLQYILHLNKDFSPDSEPKERFPLISYAAKQWPEHARAAGARMDRLLPLLGTLFLANEDAFCNWAHLYESNGSSWRQTKVQIYPDSSALFYATLLGLPSVVKLLLDSDKDPNAYHLDGGTALQVAAHHGHADIAQILLAQGADPHLIGRRFKCPLLEALSRAHEQIVLLLIDNGANLDISCDKYGSALNMALAKGLRTVAHRLLDKGTDPNAHNGPLGTPLQIVSESGDEEMLKKLLDRGANPNIHDGATDSPLQKALYHSRPQIVRLLLDAGAYANPKICGMALERAAYDGRLDMAQTLVTVGPDVHSCRGHYGVALWMASSGGHEHIVRLLLERCADMPLEYLQLAYNCATQRNHEGVAQILRQLPQYQHHA